MKISQMMALVFYIGLTNILLKISCDYVCYKSHALTMFSHKIILMLKWSKWKNLLQSMTYMYAHEQCLVDIMVTSCVRKHY